MITTAAEGLHRRFRAQMLGSVPLLLSFCLFRLIIGFSQVWLSTKIVNMNDGFPSGCTKAFVQRDYSEGMPVKFEKIFPRELEGKIPREQFEQTVDHINSLYVSAEELSCASFCEGCFACLTSYLFLCCMKTRYEKKAQEASLYIAEQNRNIYEPKGIWIVDPMLRGLRVLEFVLLNTGNESTVLTV